MKVLFAFIFLSISFIGNTQSLLPGVDFPLSKVDIVKFRISRITIMATQSPNYIMEYYLDKEGNDTALYINGVMLWMKKYYRNKSGKVIKWVKYDSSRLEEAKGI